MDIQIGDDITVGGKVVISPNEFGLMLIKTPSETSFWVSIDDIKTHRPIGRENMKDGS